MTQPGTLAGSWPVNDPDGVALRLWSDRGSIDILGGELEHLAWLVADARRRTAPVADGDVVRYPLGDLSTHGLLWLINRVALHPRGYALGIDPATGTWTMLGDGTECWKFGDYPDGTEMDDVGFARVEAFLAACRDGTPPAPTPTTPTPASDPGPSSGPDHQLQPAEPTAHLLENRPASPVRSWRDRRRPRNGHPQG